ncbi:MAG: NAD-dependent deacylase [Pseudomonadota bacterium]
MSSAWVPRSLFLLTGAGVSAESGLGTFRDKGGLWNQYRLEDVASVDGYRRNPALVLNFYNKRRANLDGAKANAAHIALARLEKHWREHGQDFILCTQNIDDLHEQAGSQNVVHMHGELKKARCGDCGDIQPYDGDLSLETGCAACGRIGGVRPHVVWFGEMPLEMERIYDALAAADLFVSIGTSGAVYPAAGFVTEARRAGIATMEINLEPSDNAEAFDAAHYGPASEAVPNWADALIAKL